MTYKQLVEKVAENSGQSVKWTRAVIDAFVAVVQSEPEVQIKGFGKFHHHQSKERMGRNPKNGAPALIPAKSVLKFKASKAKKA